MNKCIDCHNEVSRKGIKRCYSCFLLYNESKIKYCKLCGKKLSKTIYTICITCHKGKNNESYKHGRYIHKKRYCKKCNKLITIFGKSGLCRSCSISGKNHRSYIDGRSLRKHFCIDCKKEISNIYAKRCKSCSHKGKKNFMYGKCSGWKRIKYKGIWMRSSWEVAYAKYLDKQDIKWLYEPKTFDLGDTTYTPDFYLPESDTYIEIKGYWNERSKWVFPLFKKCYPKIKIKLLQKKELQQSKIIDEEKRRKENENK